MLDTTITPLSKYGYTLQAPANPGTSSPAGTVSKNPTSSGSSGLEMSRIRSPLT